MAKTAKGKGPSVKASAIGKIKLDFPLDAKKIEAIKKCLAKGKLTITASKVDLGTGRVGAAWIYD